MAQIKTTGIVTLQGDAINIDLWRYLDSNTVQVIMGGCSLEVTDQPHKQNYQLLITQAIPPERLPIKFGHKDSVFNVMISKERQAEINALFDGFTMIFNKLVEKAWLLIGYLGEDKREIAIIAIPHLHLYMYALITKDIKKVIEANKTYLN